jgi:hypothetical protein
MHLTTRLAQHNSGFGARQTSPAHLRPWAILAYVAGFNGNRQEMLSFETGWKNRAAAIMAHGVMINTVMDIAQSAVSIIEIGFANLGLIFVQTGTIGIHIPNE